MTRFAFLLAALSLAACADVISETEGTFSFQGKDYVAMTRTYSQNGRTFDRRVIYDGIYRISCSATDDLDCEAAMENDRINSGDFFR